METKLNKKLLTLAEIEGRAQSLTYLTQPCIAKVRVLISSMETVFPGDLIRTCNSLPKYQVVYVDKIDSKELTQCEFPHLSYLLRNWEVIRSAYSIDDTKKEQRPILISLDQAREWYEGTNETLRTLALSVYKETELTTTYEDILSLENTTEILNHCSLNDEKKFIILHKLSVLAAHYNGGWKMSAGQEGYFLNKHQAIRTTELSYYTGWKDWEEGKYISIAMHSTVTQAGIIYFRRKEDLVSAIKLIGRDIKYLF